MEATIRLVLDTTQWYLYDDTVVRKLDVREVAAQQTAAYLFVYQHQAKVDFRP